MVKRINKTRMEVKRKIVKMPRPPEINPFLKKDILLSLKHLIGIETSREALLK
jgi:hypothetical protein